MLLESFSIYNISNVKLLTFIFGSWDLYEGINPISLALGIFAIPEILSIFTTKNSPINNSYSLVGVLDGIKETLKNKWIVLRCSLLGTFVGAIPGIGGSVIDWLAYGITAATVKDNSNFGKGNDNCARMINSTTLTAGPANAIINSCFG